MMNATVERAAVMLRSAGFNARVDPLAPELLLVTHEGYFFVFVDGPEFYQAVVLRDGGIVGHVQTDMPSNADTEVIRGTIVAPSGHEDTFLASEVAEAVCDFVIEEKEANQ